MSDSGTGNRSGHVVAVRWLVVAMVGVVALALTIVVDGRGDGDRRVGVSASGETDDEPPDSEGLDGDEPQPGRDDPDRESGGEQGETVVVELPSALEGEPPVEVEVHVAEPAQEEVVSHAELASGAAGRVSVGEVPVEHRQRLAGSGIELEGRVDRSSSVGFWMRHPDNAENGDVFVAWGDLSDDQRPRAGHPGAAVGVWRLVGEGDDHLHRVGLEPGAAYVWALGWSR